MLNDSPTRLCREPPQGGGRRCAPRVRAPRGPGSPAGGAVERSETVGVERLVSGMASGEGWREEREREIGEGGGAFGMGGRGGGGGGEEADRYAE